MKQNNIKICNYIIENGIKLLKKNKVSKVNVLLLNNLINIELDNNCYLITNMISYKRFIDIVSNNYKIVLRYMPKLVNDNINKKVEYVYMKYNQASICLLNTNMEYKNIV